MSFARVHGNPHPALSLRQRSVAETAHCRITGAWINLISPMSPMKRFAVATFCFCSILSITMRADPTPAERVAEIQKALQAAKLDGWLFYDFRGSDTLAPRIL